MKILITSPIRNQAYCLKKHLTSLLENEEYLKKVIPEADVHYHFLTYNNNDDTETMLENLPTKNLTMETPTIYEPSTKNYKHHSWTREQLKNLGEMRNACLDVSAGEYDFDYAFMVDGDVELRPETLHKLISISKGEHVVSSIIVATWDKCVPSSNYNTELLRDGLTGITPDLNETVKLIKGKKTIECKLVYMIWLIPVKYIRAGIASFFSPDGGMEFKYFSKYLRDSGVKQLMDFEFPGVHMEKSGYWLVYNDS